MDSGSVNGMSRMRRVIRLYKPPLAWMRWSIIQEAAEPHTTRMTSGMVESWVFQMWSKAGISPDFGVAIQGSSSRITTARSAFCTVCVALRASARVLNALFQESSRGIGLPE